MSRLDDRLALHEATPSTDQSPHFPPPLAVPLAAPLPVMTRRGAPTVRLIRATRSRNGALTLRSAQGSLRGEAVPDPNITLALPLHAQVALEAIGDTPLSFEACQLIAKWLLKFAVAA